jgi:hypothetical protein
MANVGDITVKEMHDSRRWFTQEGGLEKRAVRMWKVFGTDDAPVQTHHQVLAALQATGISLPHRHPEDSSMAAADWDIRVETGSSYVWEVRWQYLPIQGLDPSGGPDPPLAFAAGGRFTVQFQDIWRTYVRRDNNGEIIGAYLEISDGNGGEGTDPDDIQDGDLDADIDGKSVDVNGRPVSFANQIGELRVEQQTTVPEEVWANIRNLSGKRNDSIAWGAPVGTLLYRGADFDLLPDGITWKFIHQFAYDSWFHMRQQVFQVDGKPQTADTFQFAGGAYKSTDGTGGAGYPVYWVQPFSRKGNFNILGVVP